MKLHSLELWSDLVSEAPPTSLVSRARKAWAARGLEPIGFHECRHTFASLMIAANVNAKALATFMGHANISITLDRYGHLMPGGEGEAAALLDAYLERAAAKARGSAHSPAEICATVRFRVRRHPAVLSGY